MPRRSASLSLAVMSAALMAACARAPRALVPNEDACDYCRMSIADVRFGGELETRTGRIHVFDSIDCLGSFFAEASSRGEVRGAWVTDFQTGRWIVADSAVYVVDGRQHAPMGRSIVALAPGRGVDAAVRELGGERRSWSEVLALVAAKPIAAPADTAAHTDTARSAR